MGVVNYYCITQPTLVLFDKMFFYGLPSRNICILREKYEFRINMAAIVNNTDISSFCGGARWTKEPNRNGDKGLF